MPGAVVGGGDGVVIRTVNVPALMLVTCWWGEAGSKRADKERVRISESTEGYNKTDLGDVLYGVTRAHVLRSLQM